MKGLVKIVNGLKQLNILAKPSILDPWLVFKVSGDATGYWEENASIIA